MSVSFTVCVKTLLHWKTFSLLLRLYHLSPTLSSHLSSAHSTSLPTSLPLKLWNNGDCSGKGTVTNQTLNVCQKSSEGEYVNRPVK